MKIIHSGTEMTTTFLVVDENGNVDKVETTKFAISKLCKEDFEAALNGVLQIKTTLSAANCIESEEESYIKQLQQSSSLEIECLNRLIDKIVELENKINNLENKIPTPEQTTAVKSTKPKKV